MSGKKSDHADAVTLANILRTDADQHRRLPADTELAQSITVLARAHQDATWRRTRAGNELRSLLREYFPGFLHAFADRPGGISAGEARAVLAIAPTPATAARLSKPQITAALRRAGRQRSLATLAATIQQQLRMPQLRQPALVEEAFGIQTLAVLATLDAECASVDRLGEATAAAVTQHPDHRIITSFVGLADLTGARLLAEIGDGRTRFADARALTAFAVRTRHQSLRAQHPHYTPVRQEQPPRRRRIRLGLRGRRLPRAQPGRTTWHAATTGDRHPAAPRHLYNRMLGQLYHYRPVKRTTRSRHTGRAGQGLRADRGGHTTGWRCDARSHGSEWMHQGRFDGDGVIPGQCL